MFRPRRAALVAAAVLSAALPAAPGRAATAYAAVPVGVAAPGLTAMTIAGRYLYATSYIDGTVVRMRVLVRGALGPPATFATGFEGPLGVAVAPDGTVFVADSHSVGSSTLGRVRALPPTGGDAATAGEIVVDGLPNSRHNTNNLLVHEGRLYITNGNSTDDGVRGGAPEQPLSGTVLSVDVTARGVAPVESPDLVVEARGLRNAYDVAFRPGTGELWTASNGPDALDPYGEDLLHRLSPAAEPAVDFGFPACVYRAGPGGPTDPVFAQNPAIATPCDAATHRAPEVTLGLHVSANGLDFAPSSRGWDGSLFVAEFGANGTGAEGHAVVRVPIDAAGNAGAPEVVVRGVTPLDLTFGPAGLYVGDFASGSITLVRPVR